MKISIQFDAPFAIGTEVYKKSDLRTLEEHAASYSELVLYQVVGYEISYDASAVEVGRTIITYKTIGGNPSSFPKKFYVHPDLLQVNTVDIAKQVESVSGLIFPRTATE